MSHNQIDDAGILALADGLRVSPKFAKSAALPRLRSLYLSNNAFHVSGVLALADILRTNRNLQHLDLEGNEIDGFAASVVLSAAMSHPNLLLLRLSCTCESDHRPGTPEEYEQYLQNQANLLFSVQSNNCLLPHFDSKFHSAFCSPEQYEELCLMLHSNIDMFVISLANVLTHNVLLQSLRVEVDGEKATCLNLVYDKLCLAMRINANIEKYHIKMGSQFTINNDTFIVLSLGDRRGFRTAGVVENLICPTGGFTTYFLPTLQKDTVFEQDAGSGNFGKVEKHKLGDTTICIKTPTQSNTQKRDIVVSQINEFSLIHELGPAKVDELRSCCIFPTMYGVNSDRFLMIALPFMEFGSLEGALKPEKWPSFVSKHGDFELVHFFDSVVASLATLHASGILHRDIAGRNILLEKRADKFEGRMWYKYQCSFNLHLQY